ncbi:response regulator (plasmid) [Kovacikia minuta CCNUW1]|uniref:hybrid sensor histidine kinase/response regulator n=1 Tax=Kovacikia minuta TaxID=2931930 RepID=UPI001CCBC403|nr:ATP-binding protein [Kovacikia minuta]UBF30487.1 response regulator [Kovacikia minuta CCNUW1]
MNCQAPTSQYYWVNQYSEDMEADAANQPEKTTLQELFAQSGEMGARIQAFNWPATPIGMISNWDQSLQIALQILLLSKFPMQILWGQDYIQFYNDAYIPILGKKHPVALGQRGEDCWREVWDFAGPLLNKVMRTGTATWSEDQLLVLERNGYPEECYFTFSYTPIWEQSGGVGGIFIAVNETTQKILSERRERELRVEAQAAKESAEKANQLKDQFLAVLSHELRSPLNPILGWAKLLLIRELDRNTTRRALEAIERNAKLQAQMIDDLLDISRVLRNKLILDLAPVQFIPIIEDALETVDSNAIAKSIQIQTQFDNTPFHILADSNRLKQAIWNLLSNAVKFTPEAGSIIIQLDYVESFAQLRVSDTGRGISADFLPHVFDHFQQADSSTTRTFGGLGLGLAIAKQIIDMHGGYIQADSPGEGQGATFTVRLPLTTQPLPPAPTEQPTINQQLSPIHVLVVEDDADNREMLAFTLERYGAKVTSASSAAAAIDTLSHCKPDVLISDIGMPGVDGYRLMQQVRSITQTSHIPGIALTAYVSEADQHQAFAAGFQAHLPKPVEPVQLVQTILKVIHTPT